MFPKLTEDAFRRVIDIHLVGSFVAAPEHRAALERAAAGFGAGAAPAVYRSDHYATGLESA
jgi:hypothetical protein